MSRERSLLPTYLLTLLGPLFGTILAVRLAQRQTSSSDVEILVWAWMLVGLPAILVAHAPAWCLIPSIARGARRPLARLAGAAALPLAILVLGVSTQWGDPEELALFALPVAPVLITLAWLGRPRVATPGASADGRGDGRGGGVAAEFRAS